MGEQKKRHAYMIMAHNQLELLSILVFCLQHERNDIFIHVDAKVEDKEYREAVQSIKSIVSRGRVFFVGRKSVRWGGYSQIDCELHLLKAAVNQGEYAFYHLLSGVDMPLKPQEQILRFFDDNQGKEFISMKIGEEHRERLQYYYPLQECDGMRNSKMLRKMGTVFLIMQKIFRINRIHNKKLKLAKGANWFDISDELARYTVSREGEIKAFFSHTLCCDEMFLQTIFVNSELYDRNKLVYFSDKQENTGQKEESSNMRYIDWKRGGPYVFRDEDYPMLISSGCLFARKFDYEVYPGVVDKLRNYVTGE